MSVGRCGALSPGPLARSASGCCPSLASALLRVVDRRGTRVVLASAEERVVPERRVLARAGCPAVIRLGAVCLKRVVGQRVDLECVTLTGVGVRRVCVSEVDASRPRRRLASMAANDKNRPAYRNRSGAGGNWPLYQLS